MEFLSLASKQGTPQSRMRNRRGPEKESFFKVFEGKKIQENHWNSWILTSNFHHIFPTAWGVSCPFNQVSLLPADHHPPAARARHSAAALGWNSYRGMRCERCSAALKAKKPPWESPWEGSGNIALLEQKLGLLPGETLETLASCSIYTSKNSATSEKSDVDTQNIVSCREIESTVFLYFYFIFI